MSWARRGALLLVASGAAHLTVGLYLPAKAIVAQVLLRSAWTRTLESGGVRRPWPWAHTWPVARLAVPRLGVETVVLAGAEGASLAFAPGHVDGTALPGRPGNTVLGGHRDTTFRFLAELRRGDLVWLEDERGQRSAYRVSDSWVVHEDEVSVLSPTETPSLTLVTCYPFDALRPGGPLRYVVRARALGPERGQAMPGN